MTTLSDLNQTEDLVLLREIFSSAGSASAFALHEKYHLSPGQIFSAAAKLEALGIASLIETEADFEIRLLPAGEVFCVANADAIWSERGAYWKRRLPERFQLDTPAKFVYYCPSIFAKPNRTKSVD